jgi:uncharacterized protein YbbK (DUF523 family)
MDERGPVIVSACLVGIGCRHDGRAALSEEALKALEGRHIVPICPEQLGGLPTPRPASEIERDDGKGVIEGASRVLSRDGGDVTDAFLKGAEMALKIARMTGATGACLKEASPSCGVESISRAGERTPGMGVTTALLKKEGLTSLKGFR